VQTPERYTGLVVGQLIESVRSGGHELLKLRAAIAMAATLDVPPDDALLSQVDEERASRWRDTQELLRPSPRNPVAFLRGKREGQPLGGSEERVDRRAQEIR